MLLRHTSIMSLSVLLLLLVCSTQASHFSGTVMTYYPQNYFADGSVKVNLRYKLNFNPCQEGATWTCPNNNCGTETHIIKTVDQESSGDWCQSEGIMTRLVPSNAPFQLLLDGGNWIDFIKNNIVSWRALTSVELRNRSDTGKANTSPQTTIIPTVRVPSNCQRNLSLLMFDPDGDEVKCRNGDALSECNPCTPPSVLSLSSSSCTLSFSPTSSINEGPYAVQLVMEDFPRQTITLTQTSGIQTTLTTNNAISKIPIQFVLRVDPAAPSCTEGLFLPRFLPPTPAHRAQLYISVNQTLVIKVTAEALNSTISELLYSGPYNIIIMNGTGPGEFNLRWTPSESEDGQSHPICFVVQALFNGTKYHSELRCVIVTVANVPPSTPASTSTTSLPISNTPSANGPAYVAALRMKLTSLMDLSHIDTNTFLTQIKDVLVSYGLPQNMTIHLISSRPQIGATAPTSTATT